MNMTEPYQTPLSPISVGVNAEHLRQRRKFWLRVIWILIAAVIVPPLFGLAGTVIRMIEAIGELKQTGKADPEALASEISVSLLRAAWSIILSFLALIALIGSFIRYFTLPKLITLTHKANTP
jgi:biopolymer transport protein ExbB/TolQ